MTGSRISSRTGQRDQARGPDDRIADLHGIAHGPDVGIACAHLFVDGDASRGSNFQPGGTGEAGFRADPQSKDDQVRWNSHAALQQDHRSAVPLGRPRSFKCGNAIAEMQADSVVAEFFLQGRRHLGIERGHDLGKSFRDADLETQAAQLLGHLQPDVAPTHYHGPPGGAGGDPLLDLLRVGDVPDDEVPGTLKAGNGRADGTGAGGDDQGVVGKDVGFPGSNVTDGHFPCVRPDFQHFGPGTDVQIEPGLE